MAIPVYLWLKDDGGADIKGSVDVQDREGSIEVVAQEHCLYIPTDNRQQYRRHAGTCSGSDYHRQSSADVEGAELRTDRHISIRGGAGVFITADKQPFASDKMLSMKEAIAQLENALSIARSLSDAAETAEALPADIQSQVKLTDALKDLAGREWC